VLVVHNEIHYVPVGKGWEEAVVRGTFWAQMALALPFQGPKKSRFLGPNPSNAPLMMLHASKPLRTAP
jgi:hypothetical protein